MNNKNKCHFSGYQETPITSNPDFCEGYFCKEVLKEQNMEVLYRGTSPQISGRSFREPERQGSF